MEAREAHVENMRSAFMTLQREYQKLHSDYEAAIAAVDDVEAKLEAASEKDEDDDYLQIRQGREGRQWDSLSFGIVPHYWRPVGLQGRCASNCFSTRYFFWEMMPTTSF